MFFARIFLLLSIIPAIFLIFKILKTSESIPIIKPNPPNFTRVSGYEDRILNYEQNPPYILKSFDYSKLANCSTAVTGNVHLYGLHVEFERCGRIITMRFFSDPEGHLLNWPTTMYVCDEQPILKSLPLIMINVDSGRLRYWAFLPNCKDNKSILLTLGVPNHTYPELEERIPNLKVIRNEVTPHDFIQTFKSLKNGAKELLIDMLWINGGDMNLARVFEILESVKITVCQINFEITNAEMFHNFVKMAFNQRGRFISMRPFFDERRNLTTAFFFNARSFECIIKYL